MKMKEFFYWIDDFLFHFHFFVIYVLFKWKKCKVEGEEDKGIKNEREYIKKQDIRKEAYRTSERIIFLFCWKVIYAIFMGGH